MDFVEQMANEMRRIYEEEEVPLAMSMFLTEHSLLRAMELQMASVALRAITATGCKVVARTDTPWMAVTNGSIYWSDLFDAAPAWPGADDEV